MDCDISILVESWKFFRVKFILFFSSRFFGHGSIYQFLELCINTKQTYRNTKANVAVHFYLYNFRYTYINTNININENKDKPSNTVTNIRI